MLKTFRELTDEELLLVAGGLSEWTITVTAPGDGGWGDDGPPSDPWGPGGPPNEPIDGGGGISAGGVAGGVVGDDGQEFRPTDVNGDGQADSPFYRGEDGKLYYRITSSAGESSMLPVTKLSGSVGIGNSTAGTLSATGPIPTAGLTYTTTTSNGVVAFEVDPTGAVGVHPK